MVLVLLLVALPVYPAALAGPASVVIEAPANGSTVVLGQEVTVSSTITAEAGVQAVVLVANGVVVDRMVPDGAGPRFCRVTQAWVPRAAGPVVLSVLAFDRAGSSSPRVSVKLEVEGEVEGGVAGADLISGADQRQSVQAAMPSIAFTPSYASIPGGATTGIVATCPAEAVVVGGGFNGSTTVVFYTQYMYGNGWRGDATNNATSSRSVSVYAVCLFGAPAAQVTQTHGQVEVPAGLSRSAEATCPTGSIMTGGGFHAYPDGDLRVASSTKVNFLELWESSAKNLTASTRTHHAYAICLSGFGSSTSVETQTVDVGPAKIGSATVGCASTSLLTAGGFEAYNLDLQVTGSLGPLNGLWNVYVYNTNPSMSIVFRGKAVCLDWALFADDFESGTTTRWAVSHG